MQPRITFLSLLLLSLPMAIHAFPGDNTWRYIDFDEAMKTDQFQSAVAVTKRIVGIDGKELLDFCRQLYRRNNATYLPMQDTPIIPKVIHQIWIGGPVPEVFKRYMESWTTYHPDWQYRLWTDDDAATFNFTGQNRALYESTDNPGVKSDILKWEIIYQFGGVYVDIDFECLKSLDHLHYQYDFYTALQPLDSLFVQLGAALFAAHPHHPVLKHCVETIKDDWHRKGTPDRTGPLHFTRSFYVTAGRNGSRDAALPAFYFYPLGCREHTLRYNEWKEHGAYAIHHWAKSWMPEKYRLAIFKNLGNERETQSWND